jgi:hypothetical protein
MTYTTTQAVVREKWIDDGATGGKTIWQTADGTWWEQSNFTKENCMTGQTVGYLDSTSSTVRV